MAVSALQESRAVAADEPVAPELLARLAGHWSRPRE
jgi:hypothetical protein